MLAHGLLAHLVSVLVLVGARPPELLTRAPDALVKTHARMLLLVFDLLTFVAVCACCHCHRVGMTRVS